MKDDKALITLLVCITIATMTLIVGGFLYNMNDRNNMAKNIEQAISKGIDPISVKCTYDSTSSSTCIAYALTRK
jgi:hypothetical protein